MGSRQAARLALTIAGMLAGSQAKEQEDRIAAQKREREGIESKANVNLTEAQTALTRQKVSEIQGQRGVQLMQSLLPQVTSGIMAPAMAAAVGPAGLGAGLALQRGAAQPMTRQLTAKEKAEQIDLEFKTQDLRNKLKISENQVRLSEMKLQEQEQKLRDPEDVEEPTLTEQMKESTAVSEALQAQRRVQPKPKPEPIPDILRVALERLWAGPAKEILPGTEQKPVYVLTSEEADAIQKVYNGGGTPFEKNMVIDLLSKYEDKILTGPGELQQIIRILSSQSPVAQPVLSGGSLEDEWR